MKKALVNTRVSVKLRKSEYRDEWYLYVESYPVFQSGKDTPQEFVNISIVQLRHLFGINHVMQGLMPMAKPLISLWNINRLPSNLMRFSALSVGTLINNLLIARLVAT